MSSRFSDWLLSITLLFVTILAPHMAHAQEPKSQAGAQAAAVALVRSRATVADSTPIVIDSAGLYRELMHCREVSGAEPTCTLVEHKVVLMVITQLTGPATALVQVRYYYVIQSSCPMGRPLTPYIGYERNEQFMLAYTDGHWKPSGGGRGMEC